MWVKSDKTLSVSKWGLPNQFACTTDSSLQFDSVGWIRFSFAIVFTRCHTWIIIFYPVIGLCKYMIWSVNMILLNVTKMLIVISECHLTIATTSDKQL